jgi:hypothetical protein
MRVHRQSNIASGLVCNSFLSFRLLRRTRSLARIRGWADAANTVGWPDSESPHPLATKKTSSRLRRQTLKSFGHRPTSTVRTAPLVRPSQIIASPGGLALSAGGRTSGREGRLRSSMRSKVLSICRQRRRLNLSAAEGRFDLLSGQPMAFGAKGVSRIRAKAHVRHKGLNDKNLLFSK